MVTLDEKTIGSLEQLYQELREKGQVSAALQVRNIINKAN